MPWIVPIFTKLAWWLVPQILNRIVDSVEACLKTVEAAEAIEDYAERRVIVLAGMATWLPETAKRLIVEACVILLRLGVTGERLDACQALVNKQVFSESADKRAVVLQSLCQMFPDMPERAGRLIVEFCVAKLRAAGGS